MLSKETFAIVFGQLTVDLCCSIGLLTGKECRLDTILSAVQLALANGQLNISSFIIRDLL